MGGSIRAVRDSDVGRDGFLDRVQFRVGSVCGVDDRGLARVFLGEAWRAGVGDPDLDGPQSLRSEGGSTLRDALCAGGCGRHGCLSLHRSATCNKFGHRMEGVTTFNGVCTPLSGPASSLVTEAERESALSTACLETGPPSESGPCLPLIQALSLVLGSSPR